MPTINISGSRGATVTNVEIDPNIARKGREVPDGGTVGQVLTRTEGTSSPYNWVSPVDSKITIKENGTTVGDFTLNQPTDETIDIPVPTKTSDLTNDGADGVHPFLDTHQDVSHLATKVELQTEVNRASGAEYTISTNLNNEISTRQSQDNILQGNINSEEIARTTADTTLTNALNSEISNRQDGDTSTLNSAKLYTNTQLTNYYNKTEVDTKDTNILNSAKGYTDQKDTATRTWADGKFLTEHQSLANYDTKEEVNTKISTATNDMATKTWSKGQVIDNTTSTINNQPLSANQGKVLSDRINNLEAVGRYLSVWNCITGKPATEPTSLPYTYKSGDYYVIGTVASSGGTNYMPHGSTYTGAASTTPYTGEEELQATMEWRYDGSTWTLRGGTGGGKVKDVLVDNVSVLSGGIAYVDLTGKQDVIDSSHKLSADYIDNGFTNKVVTQAEKNTWSAKQNAITSTNKLSSDLVDDNGHNNRFVTAGDKVTWNNKQNALNEYNKLNADYISDGTTNKVVTQTEKTTWSNKSTVSVSASGTSTDEVQYITIDGVEKKLAGGSSGGGTVTSVGTGTGLTGGPITTSGTISVNFNEVATAAQGTKADSSVQNGDRGVVKEGDTVKLIQKFYDYLENATYLKPTIATFNIKNAAGSNVNGDYELGSTVTIAKVNHKETNKDSINGNMIFKQGSTQKATLTPTNSDTTITLDSAIDVTSNTTFYLTATDTKGNSLSASKAVNFYRYAYIALSNSTTAPTSGTKKTAVSTFANSGTSVNYTAGQYLYLYTDTSGKTPATYVAGSWATVDSVESTVNNFVQANGTTHTYYAYRIGPFTASGTATYRV